MKLMKYKNYIEIISFLFKTAKENRINLKIVIVLLAVLKSLEPFPLIFFPKILIDNLIAGEGKGEIVVIVLMMVLSKQLINLSERIVMMKYNLMQFKLKNILHEELSYKVMKMEFENIENDKYIQKIERAKVAVNGDLSWSVLRGITGPRCVVQISWNR